MADHVLAAAGVLLLAQAVEPSIMGRWLTDDGDSVVEIAACGDAACGSLVAFSGDHGARDRANPDPTLRDRQVCRLELLTGLRRTQSGLWEGGRLYDPDSGASYVVSARVEASRVRLRAVLPEDGSAFGFSWSRVAASADASVACPVAQ